MGALRLLITGASGFIGRHVVADARQRNHHVTAVVRNASQLPDAWANDPGVDVVSCDLAQGCDPLQDVAHKVDVVLHCAASLSGDIKAQTRDTLRATEHLLAILPVGAKIIHLSSIAVYGLQDLTADDQLTEANALEENPQQRDAYARAKLAQEALVQASAHQKDFQITILRAGAVFGPKRVWNAHLGPVFGPLLIRMERRGQVPVCHISTCSHAMISAAERPAMPPVNLLDEDLPDRPRFLSTLQAAPRFTLPLNWRLIMPVARLLSVLGLGGRLPGLLRPEVLRTRFLPLRYDNSRMRDVLDIRQVHGFDVLMHEAQT